MTTLNDAIMETHETISEGLVSLRQRWLDEKHHEDWGDYEKAIERVFEKTLGQEKYKGKITFYKATKRPFGFQLVDEQSMYIHEMVIKSKGNYLEFFIEIKRQLTRKEILERC
jgi:hypothetical protein